jgi:hypothetical protein
MWVPKSPEENERDIRRHASVSGLFMAAFVFVVVALTVKVGYSKWKGAIDPISWTELIRHLPWILGFALAVFLTCYYEIKTVERKSRSKTLVCLNCDKNIEQDGQTTCKCGGALVDLNHAKWIETDDKARKPS